MSRNSVFYSFHFDNDVFRVQQVRKMGVLAGKEPVSPNEWEKIRKSDTSIEKWITETIADSDCVIVLIGKNTASRKWVKHEIKEAWHQNKPLFGIHINNIKCPNSGVCSKGANPFDSFTYQRDGKAVPAPKVYDPLSLNAYRDIEKNLADWVAAAKRG